MYKTFISLLCLLEPEPEPGGFAYCCLAIFYFRLPKLFPLRRSVTQHNPSGSSSCASVKRHLCVGVRDAQNEVSAVRPSCVSFPSLNRRIQPTHKCRFTSATLPNHEASPRSAELCSAELRGLSRRFSMRLLLFCLIPPPSSPPCCLPAAKSHHSFTYGTLKTLSTIFRKWSSIIEPLIPLSHLAHEKATWSLPTPLLLSAPRLRPPTLRLISSLHCSKLCHHQIAVGHR